MGGQLNSLIWCIKDMTDTGVAWVWIFSLGSKVSESEVTKTDDDILVRSTMEQESIVW